MRARPIVFAALALTVLATARAAAVPAPHEPAPPAASIAERCGALGPHLAAGAKAMADAPATGPEAFAAYRQAVAAAARAAQAAEVAAAIEALAPMRPVPAAEQKAAGCLLRAYLDARYGERMVADLQAMVGFRTFAEPPRPNWDAPEFVRQREWLAARAAALGLAFKSYDGRVDELALAGPPAGGGQAPILAVLTHGDVQPVEGQQWSSPPWEAKLVGGRIIGRGTEDDKGAVVATMYALAALRDSGWPLVLTLKLLVANGEESSWEEIPYYLERAPMPAMTLGVDAAYPVVNAQKAAGNITFRAGAAPPVGGASGGSPVAAAPAGGRWRVVRASGGSGPSIIPERGEALLEPIGRPAAEVEVELSRAAGAWALAHPPALFTVVRKGSLLEVSTQGRGGHSSVPASGHNALGDLTAFLATLDLALDPWGALVGFLGTAIGTGTDGAALGIRHHDEVMGDLTVNLAVLSEEDGRPTAVVNVRAPRGLTTDEIGRRAAARAAADGQRLGVPLAAETVFFDQPHLAPAEGRLVATLLEVWEEVTGRPGSPIAIGGGTQARLFEGGVDFGPAESMESYRGHGTDEYLTPEELHRIAGLTATALLRLAAAP